MAENRENDVLRFLHFYPLISAFQAFSRIPNDRKLNLLSNGAVQSFWGTLWLGIEPFLCLIWLSIPTDIRVSRFTFGKCFKS